MLLAGLCGVLGAWIGTTRASDLDPVTLGSSRGDSGPIREIHSIAVSGPYVFLADITDPTNPSTLSRVEMVALPIDVALVGGYLYPTVGGVGEDEDGLQVPPASNGAIQLHRGDLAPGCLGQPGLSRERS
jgi:hypothetical protein